MNDSGGSVMMDERASAQVNVRTNSFVSNLTAVSRVRAPEVWGSFRGKFSQVFSWICSPAAMYQSHLDRKEKHRLLRMRQDRVTHEPQLGFFQVRVNGKRIDDREVSSILRRSSNR